MAHKKKFEYITWLDHCALHGGGWKAQDDIETLRPMPMYSVGWVVKETKKHVTLISHGNNEGSAKGDMCIIKKCIIRRVRLKERSA